MVQFVAWIENDGYGVSVSGESWNEVVGGMESLGLSAQDVLSQAQAKQPAEAQFIPPQLRTPPKVGGDPQEVDPEQGEVVQSPGQGGCQECGGSLHPLTEEDARELYGIPVCTRCGKEMQ